MEPNRSRGRLTFAVAWGLFAACQAPRSVIAPEVPEAQTFLWAPVDPVLGPTQAWARGVNDDDSGWSFTADDDDLIYVLWYREPLSELGLLPGANLPPQPGRVPRDPDGAVQHGADGTWNPVEAPSALTQLPIFPAFAEGCGRIHATAPRPRDDLPASTELAGLPGGDVLLVGQDGRLYRWTAGQSPTVLGTAPGPVEAVATTREAVFAIDQDFRLTHVDLLSGTTRTATTDPSALDLPRGRSITVWDLTVTATGAVHLVVGSDDGAGAFYRVASLAGGRWRPWANPLCAGAAFCNADVSTNCRTTPLDRLATDDISVVAAGVCDESVLRFAQGVALERFRDFSLVKAVEGRLYAGIVGENLYVDAERNGQWQQIYGSSGGRLPLALTALDEGLMLIGYANQLSFPTVLLGRTGRPTGCPLELSWSGQTRSAEWTGSGVLLLTDGAERQLLELEIQVDRAP